MLDVEQENKASKEAEFVNSVGGKRILVAIRGGDFAHPGNKDAVDLALAPYLQGFFRRILDAGCGLGGTADYIRQIKGGVVYGVDLSDETIVYARTKYPHAHFFRADLMRGEEVKQNLAALENSDSIKTFDLICMFNVIYYVSCQLTMLSTLRAMANNKTKLMIFDYTDSGDYEQHRPKSGLNLLPQPINENNFTQLLSDAGWDLVESEDIT
ncbi:class I SAM-dependent methyltransferase, partial [bacterium]|nr:class I SAM-dependent methyltransferase [bacterium]